MLGAAGQRVARYIAQNPAAALASPASALAAQSETSDATVIRTVQALGYAGLAELKRDLAASLDRGERAATPADNMRLTLAELQDASLQAIDTVLDAHDAALATLRSGSFRDQFGRALRILHAAERIAMFGIGPSAALARYAALLLGRAGRSVRCLATWSWRWPMADPTAKHSASARMPAISPSPSCSSRRRWEAHWRWGRTQCWSSREGEQATSRCMPVRCWRWKSSSWHSRPPIETGLSSASRG
jgi:hypothetical protein